MAGERDHSIWVGDLSPEVDDLELYKFFAARFDTVRTAKGKSKVTIFLLSYFFIFIEYLSLYHSNAQLQTSKGGVHRTWMTTFRF